MISFLFDIEVMALNLQSTNLELLRQSSFEIDGGKIFLTGRYLVYKLS